MPEIIRNRLRAQELLNTVAENSGVPSSLKRNGIILGSGDENIVFPHPSRQDKVYAVTYYMGLDAEKAKESFYAHKILATIFPYNFPPLHAAYGKKFKSFSDPTFATELSGTVRGRLDLDAGTPVSHPFSAVQTFFDDLGLNSNSVLDLHGSNVLTAADGGEYYTDIVKSPAFIRTIPEEVLSGWMSSHKVTDKKTHEEREYNQNEMNTVMKSLRRLKELSPINRTYTFVDDGEET